MLNILFRLISALLTLFIKGAFFLKKIKWKFDELLRMPAYN
ncbi:hypothetical protein [Cytobacillus massiliigabonensis]|nr:hypothetical protein [Cytobacillus massiliigabonensis]